MSEDVMKICVEGKTDEPIGVVYKRFKENFGEAFFVEENTDGSIEFFKYNDCDYQYNRLSGSIEKVLFEGYPYNFPGVITADPSNLCLDVFDLMKRFNCYDCKLVVKHWYNGVDEPDTYEVKNE